MSLKRCPVFVRQTVIAFAVIILFGAECQVSYHAEFSYFGKTYHLSTSTAVYTDVDSLCSQESWTITFPETNNEYYTLRDHIAQMIDDGTLTYSSYLPVYVKFNAVPSGLYYNFFWKNESFAGDVWLTVFSEPEDYCGSVNSEACCGFIFYYSSYIGLRDTPGRCHQTSAYYLCTGDTLVDECTDGTHGCDHICHDTKSSYYCSCNDGYTISTDGRKCDDVDECWIDSSNGNCSYVCVNTDGSYNCSCPSGYSLEADGWNCDDVDECSLSLDPCSDLCVNTLGSYICSCSPGYGLDTDGTSCYDIDECSLNLCSHTCTNSIGSFECFCPFGYTLSADYQECVYLSACLMNPCNNSQICTDHGAGNYTCECVSGYYVDPVNRDLCTDVDECLFSNTCPPKTECTNYEGGFSCECLKGYKSDSLTSSCEDIDECERDTDNCEHNCTNTHGSFLCSCDEGYELHSNNFTCIDMDECSRNDHNCSQACSNFVGGYNCECIQGYEINMDNTTCNDINECAISHQCEHNCHNIPGGYYCSCDPGFDLMADLHSCEDIDECSYVSPPCQHECNNTVGSFICSCPQGYTLALDLTNCLAESSSCGPSAQNSSISAANINDEVATIKRNLLLDPKALSSHTRKLKCAEDDRPSARAVGAVGIIISSCVVGFFIVMDIARVGLYKKYRTSTPDTSNQKVEKETAKR